MSRLDAKPDMGVLDTWCSDNHSIVCGLVLLVGAFILSFSCKTAWGVWKNRNEG